MTRTVLHLLNATMALKSLLHLKPLSELNVIGTTSHRAAKA